MDRAVGTPDIQVQELKRDLREFTRQTNLRLLVGAFVLLFGVGVTLIYFIYGAGAALAGLLCLLAALVPIGLIFLGLYGIDWIVKRARSK